VVYQGGESATAQIQVAPAAPGIFADANGNTVPYPSGSAGQSPFKIKVKAMISEVGRKQAGVARSALRGGFEGQTCPTNIQTSPR